MINYVIIALMLTGIIISYANWAKRLGIIDSPNQRSSHSIPTVRGAGIIFPIAVLIWGFLFGASTYWMITGISLIGLIGFLDDKYTLSQLPRLLAQLIAVCLIIADIDLHNVQWHYIVILIVLISGWLNTFNFMDGINGMSVLYSLSVLSGLLWFNLHLGFTDESLLFVMMIALVIFGYFNVRPKALAFAGDVGSLTLGLFLAFVLVQLMIELKRWEVILFVAVYGVDSVLTIIKRILLRQNIFEPHRQHLYQILVNEVGFGHIIVSMSYALLQSALIIGFMILDETRWVSYSLISLAILVGLHQVVHWVALKSVKG